MAWMLMSAMHIPKDKWAQLLSPTLGALPNTQQQYNEFVQYVRRQGHLFDGRGGHDKTIQQQFVQMPFSEQNDWMPAHATPQVFFGGASDQQSYEQYPTHAHSYFGDNDDEDDSSGWSNNSEPVDLTEVANLDAKAAGELLYLGYRTHKKKVPQIHKHATPRKG